MSYFCLKIEIQGLWGLSHVHNGSIKEELMDLKSEDSRFYFEKTAGF